MKISVGTSERNANFTPAASKVMGIDDSSIDLIIKSVTDMYSDPVTAMLREVVSNAIDSHRQAGTSRPVEVNLPGALNPTFTVQDRGIGMSREDMLDIYTTYGRSTKRDSNDAIGGFGYGSKSPLASVSRFTVEAVKDGKTNVGTVFMDEQGRPSFDLIIDDVDTDEPNGVTVSIPFTNIDTSHAFKAWQGFTRDELKIDGVPNPVSLFSSPNTIKISNDTWIVPIRNGMDSYSHQSYGSMAAKALIGGVVYDVSFDDLGDVDFKNNSSTSSVPLVTVGIGDVDMSPTRESLIYSERNKMKLISAVRKAFQDTEKFIVDAIGDVEHGDLEALKGIILGNKMLMALSNEFREATNNALAVKYGDDAPVISHRWAYGSNIARQTYGHDNSSLRIPLFSGNKSDVAISWGFYSFRSAGGYDSHLADGQNVTDNLPLLSAIEGNTSIDLLVTEAPSHKLPPGCSVITKDIDGIRYNNAYYVALVSASEDKLNKLALNAVGEVITYDMLLERINRKQAEMFGLDYEDFIANSATSTLYTKENFGFVFNLDGSVMQEDMLDKNHEYHILTRKDSYRPHGSYGFTGIGDKTVKDIAELLIGNNIRFIYMHAGSEPSKLADRMIKNGYKVVRYKGQKTYTEGMKSIFQKLHCDNLSNEELYAQFFHRLFQGVSKKTFKEIADSVNLPEEVTSLVEAKPKPGTVISLGSVENAILETEYAMLLGWMSANQLHLSKTHISYFRNRPEALKSVMSAITNIHASS